MAGSVKPVGIRPPAVSGEAYLGFDVCRLIEKKKKGY